jgi:putative copper resistance protein D
MNAIEALAIVRFVHFASVMILFEAWLFPLYAVSQKGGTGSQRGRLPRTFYTAATTVAVASGIAWMACSFVDITGSSANFFDGEILSTFFLDTEFGPTWVVRLFVLGLLAFVVIWRCKELRVEYCAAISSFLLASQAWLGHAAAGLGTSGNIAIGAYTIHTLAAGAWIGGLFPLGVCLVSARNGTIEDLTSVVLALDRFSVMGMIAVPLIIVSGLLNVAFRLDGLTSALISTSWGRTLCIKLVMVITMVALAMANRFLLLPRLKIGTKAALPALARNVFAEQGLGLIVIAAAAILGILPPPQ